MSKKEEYAEQVRLLIRLLPIIDEEDCFALKGDTAINLFYRDLPRLSVDIDLLPWSVWAMTGKYPNRSIRINSIQ